MSDEMRCPNCGSHEVECVERPHHNHLCNDCGYSMLPERVDLGGGMVVPICELLEDE